MNWATSSCKHIVKRIVVMFAISLGILALLGWLKQQVWFYTGLGVDARCWPASNDAHGAGAVHAGAAGVHVPVRRR